MKSIKLSLIVATLIGFTLSAYAEKKKNVQYRKTQEVSFDAADIDGAIRSPDGAYVNPKKGVKFMPLYKVDKAFDREIRDSVEYLK
jgi:ethanolamine utilization protein EutP (predicted NTPase)